MTTDLQPDQDSPRNSPIAAAFLTNADLDHAMGLLLLRQRETALDVFATEQTRTALSWLDALLDRFCRLTWKTFESQGFVSLGNGIAFRAIELTRSIALQLQDETSKATALVAPSVGELTDELRDAVNSSNVVFFDGTFWSDNELHGVRASARTAREMNHLPINEVTLELLQQAAATRKIYTHINNTNPILMPGSKERKQVEEAGIEIACDGLEVTL